MDIRIDDGGTFEATSQKFQEMELGIKAMLAETTHEALDLIGQKAVGDHMVMASKDATMLMRPAGDKLTVRSGRQARSYLPQGGAFGKGGQREGIQEVRVCGNKIIGTKGSKVPYAAIHEYGGTIRQIPTPKQRSFFWAMAYATGYSSEDGASDNKFAAMALSKNLTINIKARPSLTPAAEESLLAIQELFKARLAAYASGYSEA